jgi:P4 family phage/plasmid primase-like protien
MNATDANTVANAENRALLYTFKSMLNRYKLDKGVSGITHTVSHPFNCADVKIPRSSIGVPDEERDAFNTLFTKVADAGYVFPLTETPSAINQFIIDLDFKYVPNTPRKHNDEWTTKFVAMTFEVMNEYVDASAAHAYVMERPALTGPYQAIAKINDVKTPVTKDGIHIIFTGAFFDIATRTAMLDKVLAVSAPHIMSLSVINRCHEILDAGSIKNNWYIYGAGKPDHTAYEITHILDSDGAEVPRVGSTVDLIKRLSVATGDAATPLRDGVVVPELVAGRKPKTKTPKSDAEATKLDIDTKVQTAELSVKLRGYDVSSREYVTSLLGMLAPTRYAYQLWRNVGYALNKGGIDNHGNSDFYLKCFLDWSRVDSGFTDDATVTSQFRALSNAVIRLDALNAWARRDNPSAYKAFTDTNVSLRLQELSYNVPKGNNYILAEFVVAMYPGRIKCVKTGIEPVFWQFVGHRWVQHVDATFLYAIMRSSAFCSTIEREAIRLSKLEGDLPKARAEKLFNWFAQLNGTALARGTIEAISRLEVVRDVGFLDKLDANCWLLGCNNGVYDLKEHCLRPGQPEDRVSFSVGINFPTASDPVSRARLFEIFNDILKPDMLAYALRVISTWLCGHRIYEEYYILTGNARNGKGILMDLVLHTMGDYYSLLPPDVLCTPSKSAEGATPYIADKKGKRIADSHEPPAEGAKLQGNILKALTGGDTITTRALYGTPFSFTPQFAVVVECNDMPDMSGADAGCKMRKSIILFPWRFVEPHEICLSFHKPINKMLKDTFCKDMALRQEFLLLLSETFKEVRTNFKEGLRPPQESLDMIHEYFEDANPVIEWFNKFYKDTGPDNWDVNRVQFKTLWTRYKHAHSDMRRLIFENRLKDFLPDRIEKDTSEVKWIRGIAELAPYEN